PVPLSAGRVGEKIAAPDEQGGVLVRCCEGGTACRTGGTPPGLVGGSKGRFGAAIRRPRRPPSRPGGGGAPPGSRNSRNSWRPAGRFPHVFWGESLLAARTRRA